VIAVKSVPLFGRKPAEPVFKRKLNYDVVACSHVCPVQSDADKLPDYFWGSWAKAVVV
jgi:hypothetical protein